MRLHLQAVVCGALQPTIPCDINGDLGDMAGTGKALMWLAVVVAAQAIDVSQAAVASRADDIPPRCLDHSVTAVSCAAAGADSLLPHPDDCQLFYYCVGAAAVCRACPAGLHFSPTEHVCDAPEHAGCTLTTTTTETPA